MSDPFAQLDFLLDHVWDRLERGAADATDPFHFAVLATNGAEEPEARTVGLRRGDREAGEVEVHSDLRTGKIRALSRDPRAALLFWDPNVRVQLRLALDMCIVSGDSIRWARIPMSSRENYGTDPAPGTPVATPEAVGRKPDIGRFAALIGRVRRIDALSLAHDPHRRAIFDGVASWVAP